jgi:hypothetical protein
MDPGLVESIQNIVAHSKSEFLGLGENDPKDWEHNTSNHQNVKRMKMRNTIFEINTLIFCHIMEGGNLGEKDVENLRNYVDTVLKYLRHCHRLNNIDEEANLLPSLN